MRRTAIILALLFTLLTFAGCAAKGYSSDSMTTQAYPEIEAEVPMSEDADYDNGGVAGESIAGSEINVGTAYGGRKIIRYFDYHIETDDFDNDYSFLLQTAGELGGYVQASSVYGRKPETYGESGRNASIALRIPADNTELFRNNIAGIGTITSQNENTDDVTEAYFDIDTRLSVLRTQLDRLTSILVSTDNLSDVIELEREIANVTLQIEELTTELRRYDGLIDYSTFTIYLVEDSLTAGPAAEKTIGQRMSEGFSSTLSGIGVFLENAAVFLVVASPILLIVVVLPLVIVLICVKSAKKKRTKQLMAAQAAAAAQQINDIDNTNENESEDK